MGKVLIGPFNVRIVSGQSKPSLTPPQVQLALLIRTGNTGGTITARWSDTSFDGSGPITMTGADTLSGTITTTYRGYIDDSNALFGTGTLVGTFTHTGTGGADTIVGPGPTTQPFSMTTEVVAVMAPLSGFSLAGLDLMGTPPPPLVLNCAASTGQVNVPYMSSITATGGVPPYTFSITGGSLPGGLTLNSTTGAITGTPTQAGTFSFTAQVQDSNSNTVSNTLSTACTIIISPPPPISLLCPTTTGQVGVAYASKLTANGGVPPYTFSIISGSLPDGLTLDTSTGNITGIPSAAGSFSFTAQVKDSTNTSAGTTTSNCGITIGPAPSATCAVINAVQGVPITPVAVTGSGGAGGPYTFSATGLPAGLSMASDGTISGTPTSSGTFSYTVTVKDSAGNLGIVHCSVTVNPPVSATCVTVVAVQGVAITPVTMVGSGGTGGPYTFSATGLPAGLTMSTTGTISGTPPSTAPSATPSP